MEIILQIRGRHRFLARQHLVGVAADGIDLTVMYDETVRMRPLPARISIRAETGVHGRDRRFVVRALQVSEELAELPYQEHTLVDDRSAGEGGNVGILVALLKLAARHIQSAVERQTFLHIRRFFDKRLHNAWHLVERLLSEHLRYCRNGAPAEKFQTFLAQNNLKHLHRLFSLQLILREEKLTNAVFPLLTNRNAEGVTGFGKEFVRNL